MLFLLITSCIFLSEEEQVTENPRIVALLSHIHTLFQPIAEERKRYRLIRYTLVHFILYLQERTLHTQNDGNWESQEDTSLLLILKLSVTINATAVMHTVRLCNIGDP